MDLVDAAITVQLQLPIANVWLAFKESSWMGYLILSILAVCSIVTWTLCLAKGGVEKDCKLNHTLEQKLHPSSCNLSTTEGSFGTHRSHYQNLLLVSLKAFFRPEFGANYHSDDEGTYTQRMNQVESALQLAVAKRTDEYEKNMVFISIIVTSAPFLGLFGPVWGVMEAFGAIGLSGGGSIKDLAPGVSSALLTTVGGLAVAIPSVFGYNLLLDNVRRLTIDIENFASQIADRFELDRLKDHPVQNSSE